MMNILSHFRFISVLLSGTLLLCVNLSVHANEIEEANTLFKQGHQSQALDKVNAYLANQPKDAQARFLKGLIFTEQGKTAEAIKIFTALTEDYPDLPEPYNNLAVLYAGQGQYEKARQALEMAIRTHPSYATAHENLGDIYAKMASEAYDRALKLDSSNTATQTKLAMIQELFAGSSHGKETTARNAEVPNKAEAKVPVIAATDMTAAAQTEPSAQLPKSPSENDESKQAQEAVMAWAAAWSSRDVPGYLSFYADDFKTPAGETRAVWEAARKDRLTAPKYIHVDIRILTIKFIDSNHASMKLNQSYKSSQLKSSGTKSLLMVKSGGKWLIQEELAR
ncbi:MAG: tetratricopeptide repeat protein [Gallionella sp.]